jgi:Flp pilus assembly pilin Flp
MLNQIKKFMLDDSGLETVEWAIVGGIVVAVGAAVFALIGGDVKSALDLLRIQTLDAAA